MQWFHALFENNHPQLILIVTSVILFFAVLSIMGFRYPYQSAKKHGFIVASVAFFIAIIYAVESYAHFKEIQSWTGIADNILSGSIFAILCVLFWQIEKRIKNRSEDAEKLRQDYAALAEKYKQNNLIKVVNPDGHTITYPIISLGMGIISLEEGGNSQIAITDAPDEYYHLPTIIENHYADIFSIHDTSNIYNNLNVRVKSMKIENNRLELTTMRTTYFDSLVTNRASDFIFVEGLSVRELFETGPRMAPLEKSRLSNHLGFNGFVESSDGYIAFVKRSGDMSIAKRTYGDSIEASLKTKFALDQDGNFTYQGLYAAIIGEIHDELKIAPEDVYSINIVAAYRDCVECGKPQLLVYAKSSNPAAQISTNFSSYRSEEVDCHKKLDKKQRQELNALVDGTKLVWISKDSLLNDIIFYYDGLGIDKSTGKEGFVTFDERGKKLLPIHFINMFPSASAAVIMLKRALKTL